MHNDLFWEQKFRNNDVDDDDDDDIDYFIHRHRHRKKHNHHHHHFVLRSHYVKAWSGED